MTLQERVTHESRRYERQVLRYVEAEMYAYPWRKQEIERLRADIIGSTSEQTMAARAEGVGDPTLSRAMRILTSKRLERLLQTQDAISRVYERLPPEKRRLVEMRYWQREYTDYGIYTRLCISRRAYFYWRDGILKQMAGEMGLL